MSRIVQLRVDNGEDTIGTVELPSDFPGIPQLILWNKKAFLAQGFYGDEFYSEIQCIALADDALVPPPPGPPA